MKHRMKCARAKLGGAGDLFGECLCVDCANLPYASRHNQFTNTKFDRPYDQISKFSKGRQREQPSFDDREIKEGNDSRSLARSLDICYSRSKMPPSSVSLLNGDSHKEVESRERCEML